MKKKQKICKNNDFKNLYRNGLKLRSQGFVVYCRKSKTHHRMGIVISRKFGNAVVRNKFKRRVRAWFTSYDFDAQNPYDILVIATHTDVTHLTFNSLTTKLNEVLGKFLKLNASYEF